MKKILFLFMMFMGLISSLYASPPNIGNTFNINAGQENVNARQKGKTAVAAHADKKVIISHKDTLLYSWGDNGDNKLENVSLIDNGGDGLTASRSTESAWKTLKLEYTGEGGV